MSTPTTAALARAPALPTTTSARPEASPKPTTCTNPATKTATYPKPTAALEANPVISRMREAQLRLKMGSMTREQLEKILIQVSQSPSPSDTAISRLMADTVPFQNQVETFIDQIDAFETQIKGLASGWTLLSSSSLEKKMSLLWSELLGR